MIIKFSMENIEEGKPMIMERDFFKDVRPHTQLKIDIFMKTLSSCVGIANNYQKKGGKNNFVYIDLYAGKGLYESGAKGSPLIAIDIIIKHMEIPNNKFDKAYVLLIEEDKKNFAPLYKDINNRKSFLEERNIYAEVKLGQWEKHKSLIKEYLVKSTFGFVFLDPFISVNFEEFNDIINSSPSGLRFKDIMMLFNIQSIRRNLNNKEALSKLEEKIKIELKDITEDYSYQKIISLIKEYFNKDFKTGISIPITKKNKLNKMDYFILFLFTNSIGLADNFLKAYSDYINKLFPNRDGFDPGFNLKIKINNFLKNKNSVSFFELISFFHKNVISFKEATITSVQIPTLENVIKILDKMHKDQKIIISSEISDVFGKKKTLLKSKIKNRKIMEKIKIVKTN